MKVNSRNPEHIGTRVWLNGVQQPHALEADDEAGYVIVASKDERGCLVRDGNEIATKRLEGRVTLELPDRA